MGTGPANSGDSRLSAALLGKAAPPPAPARLRRRQRRNGEAQKLLAPVYQYSGGFGAADLGAARHFPRLPSPVTRDRRGRLHLDP